MKIITLLIITLFLSNCTNSYVKNKKTIEKMRSDGEILENNYKFVRNV